MIKTKPCSALKDLIDTNTLNLNAAGWVEWEKNADTGQKSWYGRKILIRILNGFLLTSYIVDTDRQYGTYTTGNWGISLRNFFSIVDTLSV